ncbi:hypothetical protein K8Z61_05490 [Nocardioides sp. TRM66260-LWL]|uniref:hypothetical protein n=1 Tax=Nocardioides sp. TRM66260-LWL TaxID=2874478 RepID=UPI001CC81795|nr:hypothetical protein [Nocardioides sp. TRM66260-LWL]MBZ5733943.1 hypothetical protein [Nocardioides sp. TRM66260-LWL]
MRPSSRPSRPAALLATAAVLLGGAGAAASAAPSARSASSGPSARASDPSTRLIDADCGALGHLVGRVQRDTPARATLYLALRGGPPGHRLTYRLTQPGGDGSSEWYPQLDEQGNSTGDAIFGLSARSDDASFRGVLDDGGATCDAASGTIPLRAGPPRVHRAKRCSHGGVLRTTVQNFSDGTRRVSARVDDGAPGDRLAVSFAIKRSRGDSAPSVRTATVLLDDQGHGDLGARRVAAAQRYAEYLVVATSERTRCALGKDL